MTYDIENLLTDVKALLVAHFNTKVAAIEAEKIAAGFPDVGLLPVDTTKGYFEQSWADNNLNITPAIMYGVENIEAVGTGPATSQRVKIYAVIVLVDSGQDTLTKNRVHRYTRAFKEVFEEKFDRLGIGSVIKIETILPVSLKLDENSSEEMKIGGVSITTSIA